MKKYYIIIPIIGFFIGFLCRWISLKSKDISDEYRMYKVLAKSTTLERKIIEYGDTISYYRLFRESYTDILLYDIIMANKYNFAPACGDVYSSLYTNLKYNIITDLCKLGRSKKQVDSVTAKITIDYLKRAVKANNNQSKGDLGEFYIEGKYIKRNTILGKRLQKEAKVNFNFYDKE